MAKLNYQSQIFDISNSISVFCFLLREIYQSVSIKGIPLTNKLMLFFTFLSFLEFF